MILTTLKFAAALGLVLSLILILAYFARRYGFGMGGSGKGTRRMKIVEILPLDTRRRLMLVRKDNTEHLILLGATCETVLSSKEAAPARDDAP